jgi:hypothetical protein
MILRWVDCLCINLLLTPHIGFIFLTTNEMPNLLNYVSSTNIFINVKSIKIKFFNSIEVLSNLVTTTNHFFWPKEISATRIKMDF